MDLRYRLAKYDDLESLVALLSNDTLGSKREDLSIPLNKAYIEAFEAIVKDQNNKLLVVELESRLVGMLQIAFIPYLTHIGSWRCLIEGSESIVTIVDKVSVKKCLNMLLNLPEQMVARLFS